MIKKLEEIIRKNNLELPESCIMRDE